MKNIVQGFSSPSQRIEVLKEQILDAVPRIETERALLITESYKETEGQPAIIRRAKALEKILAEIPIVIRDQELIVGSLTQEPRSSQVFPEFSNKWIKDEFDRVGKRNGDAFQISEEAKLQLEDVFEYWSGKTTSELATSYMSEEAKSCLNHNVFTVGNYYMNGVGHISVDYAKVLKKGFKGILEDTVVAMNEADDKDPSYIKKYQFYKAIIIICEAAIKYAQRYAEKALELSQVEFNPARKKELKRISEVCMTVPKNGATNFYEACQSFWFIHAIINIESNGHSISPGRFDQYMYPYFQMDQTTSKEEAQELVDCIWVKLNDINKVRDEVSTNAFGGYPMFQNLIVGGQTREGMDATNELSYMAIEATAHVQLPQPSFSVRVWSKSPDQFLVKACELSRLGLGVPAYYNDEVIIPALVNRGLTLSDARNYAIIGCVEPQSPGKTEGWHDSAFFNLPKVLEITLNNGMCNGEQIGPKTGDISQFTSIEAIIEAYKKQMEYFVSHLAAADNCVDYAHAERAPLPFLSSMVDDCISVGKSLQEGGAHYNFTGPQGVGAANVGDSFMAIKKLVFEEKTFTLQQLKEALDCNFGADSCNNQALDADKTYDLVLAAVKKVLGESGNANISSITDKLDIHLGQSTTGVASNNFESIRQALIKAPKFGNDIDEVDMLTREGALIYCREVEKHTNPRGGKFQAGLYPASINVLMGTCVGATPDGRKAKEPLSDGVSPSRGADTSGPTAATNSVAKLDHFIASNGTLYNQKFHPSAIQGDSGLQNLASLVRGYFDQKGMHIQFNIIDKAKLVAAQQQPEKYRDLVIRVAGYSAQFIALDKAIQDDIIMRTEHNF
ncbi:MAG: glycyl radical protein [Anaerobacillus sp.]|uniref:glycyl radical protein n=1 Tax=Anaerobacillus sp. TaxID=1872506 RepID=UPI00391BA06A